MRYGKNSSRLGTRREYAVIAAFIERGYAFLKAHRSGQAISEEHKAARIPCDMIVVSPRRSFQVEVGGASKVVFRAFAELRSRLLPGFRPLVVKFINGQRWYYGDEDSRFKTLLELEDWYDCE